MSQHILTKENWKFVFGWDQPLMSFYFQVHDLSFSKDDENQIKFWLGASPATKMYEVDELVAKARQFGCDIPYETQVKLYGEKDEG